MSDFLSQVVATVIGAVIGAVVSFVVARQGNTAVEARDQTRHKQLQRSMLLKLQMRASILVSDVVSTMRTIDGMLVSANQDGRTGWPKHARIQPIVGPFEAVSFPIEELEPLMDAKEYVLANGLVEISMRQRAFLEAVSAYSKMRLQLKEKVTISSTQGNIASTSMPAEEYKQLKPYLIELETLISQAMTIGRDLEVQAQSITAKIGPAARKFLSDESFPGIEFIGHPGDRDNTPGKGEHQVIT